MRTFVALLLKEEKAIFTSPIAYVVLSVFLVIMGYTFTLTLFVSHVPTLVHLFFQIYVLFLLTVPIITMRLVRGSPRKPVYPAQPRAFRYWAARSEMWKRREVVEVTKSAFPEPEIRHNFIKVHSRIVGCTRRFRRREAGGFALARAEAQGLIPFSGLRSCRSCLMSCYRHPQMRIRE